MRSSNSSMIGDRDTTTRVGSTLITDSSSTVYDATTLYSKVACYTVELLTKLD